MSELSRRILQRRLELGLSQEELAQRMGYRSKSSITKLEKGVNDIPQSKVEEFAAALETTPAWLMGLENTAFVPPGFEPLPEMVRYRWWAASPAAPPSPPNRTSNATSAFLPHGTPTLP